MRTFMALLVLVSVGSWLLFQQPVEAVDCYKCCGEEYSYGGLRGTNVCSGYDCVWLSCTAPCDGTPCNIGVSGCSAGAFSDTCAYVLGKCPCDEDWVDGCDGDCHHGF